MRDIAYIFFSVMLLVKFWSCGDNDATDPVPKISFVEFNKGFMVQNSLNTDSILIRLAFEDQDGDIGGMNSQNITVIDNRTKEIYDSFSFPSLPLNGKPAIGEVNIRLFTTCCIFPDRIPPCETPEQFPINELSLDIFITDEAGNKSNTITTPLISLLCR